MKKKILCLINNLGAGGAQRQLVGLATFLKGMDYDVSVAFYDKVLFYAEILSKAGVPYHYLDKAHNTKTRLYFISTFVRQVKPDVVISYLDTPNICGCISKLFTKKFRLIVSERNTTQHTGWNERIRFNLYRLADCIVPNSFSQETYIRNFFPFLSSKVKTIPNFVDIKHFTPIERKKRNAIPEIMIAATIWPSKNTIGFIDAVVQLKNKGYSFHVSWYGKNEAYIDYFNSSERKILEMGVSEYIQLKEKTTEIKECYQNADYFCLPSFYEGTPNVIGEAMACGLPVACSDVCDNSRYVTDGVNGFLFNPNDTFSIVNALEMLLSMSEDDYMKFSNKSREDAVLKLSKKRFLDSYLKIIEGNIYQNEP